MSLQSSFKNVAPTDFLTPAPHTPHHNLLHNLLDDAINTAKGIPFGMIQTVEHPRRSLELMGKSYADTYGHGWHHFETSFMNHPLQPLLDAISVPLVLAGGLGVAVKGASAAAELGRTAEMADLLAQSSKAAELGNFAEADTLRAQAMSHPKLDAAAQHFRKGTSATTRMVEVKDMPGVSLPYAYSSNLFRRAMTRGSMALLEKVSPEGSFFSKEGLGKRMLVKEESKRAAATAARSKGQAAVLLAAKKAGLDPNEVIQKLGDNLHHSLLQNALAIDAKFAHELAQSRRFRSDFGFIRMKPDLKVEAELHDVEDMTHQPLGPDRQLTAGDNPVKYGTDQETHGIPVDAHEVQDGAQRRPLTMEGYGHDQMLNAIKTMAKTVKTTKRAELAMEKDGKVFIVRKGTKDSMVKDMEDSAKLANAIYKVPLTMWKGFILGLSPRYFVNNVIGNAGMYAAATNPVEFTRGVLQAAKTARGLRAAGKLERGMETTIDQLMNKWMPDEWVNARFGYLQHGALGVDQTAGVRLKGALTRAKHAKFYAVTEKIAYRGPQRASLMGALHTDRDFRNLYANNVRKGMERGQAYRDAADTIIGDPRKQAALEKRVTDWAGQYYHLNSLEKKLTAVVPFYTWDRHALRFGKEQVLSRPVSSIVLAQLGALGDKEADKQLGKVPDFMKGAIPVSGHSGGILGLLLGQNIAGRKKILLTSGYNPLAAAADDAAAIAAVFGQGPRPASEAIGGQVNPVVSGFLSGVTGNKLFSGAKANTTVALGGKGVNLGPIGGVIHETGGELPHVKLIREALGEKPKTTTSKGTPTLYEKGMRQTVSSILGLNERDFSPVSAKNLYNEENHIKKGRRRKKKDAMKALTQLKSNF